MTDRRTLTPQDWIDAGCLALAAHGPLGVRAEALARSLGVSKGSFYWHFADLAALQAAMLADWEAAATAAAPALVPGQDPVARLMRLLEAPAAARGGRKLEAALRDWARTDPRAAAALDRVETSRLAGLKEALIAAKARQPGRAARLIHAALIGLEALPRHDPEDSAKDLALLLKKLLP